MARALHHTEEFGGSYAGRHSASKRAYQEGLSLEPLSSVLKVKVPVLQALEEIDSSALLPACYVRGYLQSYAREVGPDSDEIIAEYIPIESAGRVALRVSDPSAIACVDGPQGRSLGRAGHSVTVQVTRDTIHHYVME